MSLLPHLLNPQQFSEESSAAEAFLTELGQLSIWPGIELASLLKIHDDLSPAVRPVWLRSVARELLLKASWSEPEADLWTLFEKVPPFDNGPQLSAHRGQRWAAAMFPLDMPTGAEPAVGQIWATTAGDDIPELPLEGAREIQTSFPNVRFRALLPPPLRVVGMPSGRSWQFAAALAARALTEAPIHSGTLAAYWITTGSIARSSDGVTQANAVELGNKLNLLRCLGQRRWCIAADQLITAKLKVDEAANAYPGKLWPTPDLETAWRTVIRQGTLSDLEETDWPVGVPEYHTFVSPALGPCLASILHFQPRRLILWCSDEMKNNKTLDWLLMGIKKSRAALGQNLPPPCVIPLTATALIEAEARLGEHPSLVSYSGSPVYFNLTNGNLLQRLAAYTLAQRNPDIWMIYREGTPRLKDGKQDGRFDLLRFRSRQPTSGKLKHVSISNNSKILDWNGLMKMLPLTLQAENPLKTADDPVNELLKRAGLLD
jgi:hypothetical protein